MLINPPAEACAAAKSDEPVAFVPEEATIVGTFLAQLKLLLGIPEPVIIRNVLTKANLLLSNFQSMFKLIQSLKSLN